MKRVMYRSTRVPQTRRKRSKTGRNRSLSHDFPCIWMPTFHMEQRPQNCVSHLVIRLYQFKTEFAKKWADGKRATRPRGLQSYSGWTEGALRFPNSRGETYGQMIILQLSNPRYGSNKQSTKTAQKTVNQPGFLLKSIKPKKDPGVQPRFMAK